jgi:asparagine synthase (glutamine-hydrolysing)
MFGGYDIFKEAKIRRFCIAQPNSRFRPHLLRKLYPYMANIQAQPDAYLRGFFQLTPGARMGLLSSHMPRWQLGARNKLFFSEAVKEELGTRDIYSEIERELPSGMAEWKPFCQGQYLEARYLLPGYILSSQGDRMAMASAVEGRYPFLDYRVMEFAAKLPPHLKMKALNEKYLLKRTFGKLIPASIARRPKQPYRAPEARCFFTPGVSEYVQYLLSPEKLRSSNLFHPAAVERLVEKVRSNQAIGVKDNMALVGIVSTQMVADQFVERFSARPEPHVSITTGIVE